MTEEESFAAIDRSKVNSIGDIFLHFVTPEVLTAAWDSFPREYWCYGSGKNAGTFGSGIPRLKLIYTLLAVYIAIVGEQNAPKEGHGLKRPLRSAIKSIMDQFQEQFPEAKLPSHSILDRFWGRFYLPTSVWSQLCNNFQCLLKRPGRALVGDEKLLRFTGDSGYIRLVPSKPDRVGLWFFELVVTLNNGCPYLVHTMLSKSNPSAGENIPVNTVVREWAKVAKFFMEEKKSKPPILTFDSFYTDNEGRRYLNENGYLFIGSVQTSRFRNLMDQLAEHADMVDKPGQTSDTNELFVHHWDILTDIGKKYVLSHAR